MIKQRLLLVLLLSGVACAPQPPPSGLQALQQAATWNQAREVYFHATKAPVRSYKIDGEKGEIIDVHVYKSPRADLLLVTYGETYHNTTGWDVHIALMKTNDVPAYPGNVYLCPVGADFAVDWLSDDTLAIFYGAGYYPEKRDYKTGRSTKSPDFQYEKELGGIKIKFLPVDRATMDAKEEAMSAREIKARNSP